MKKYTNNYFFYFFPPELLDEKYKDYSIKSKLLFAIVLTEAENGSSINELAELIESIGVREVTALYKQLQKDISEYSAESEGV